MIPRQIKPFISSRNRYDILIQLARQSNENTQRKINELIVRGLDPDQVKLDGKAGGADGGLGVGSYDKKDGGKDGGKDGKETKEQKDGKEGEKEDKDSSDGSEKLSGNENEFFRFGDERILPADTFSLIFKEHSEKVITLLSQPIF